MSDLPIEAFVARDAEAERLRSRVNKLEADIAGYKKLIADELAETFMLFSVVGLNEADDFGTKTAIEAVRERIESIKASRDSWKHEALAARELLSDYGIEKKSWHGDYPSARAANEVSHD